MRILTIAFFVSFFWSSLMGESPRLVIDSHGHSGMIKDLVFTPDGSKMISVGMDKVIRVWSVSSGDLVRSIRTEIGDAEDGKHYACAISPSGRFLAVAGWGISQGEKYGVISVIDLVENRLAATLHGHTDVVHSLDFSADGTSLLSGSSDMTARVWSVDILNGPGDRSAVQLKGSIILKGHVNKVYGCRFLDDGDRVVTASFDHSVRFWERAGNGFSEKALFGDHAAAITKIAVSPDSRWIATGDLEGKLFLWNAQSLGLSTKLDTKMELMVGALAFSPDSSRLLASSVAATGGKSAIYRIPAGGMEKTFSFHDNSVTAAAWHKDGKLAALAGSNANRIDLFEVDSGNVVHSMQGKGAAVWNVAMHSEGEKEFAIGFIPPEPNPTVQAVFDFSGFHLKGIETAEEAMQYHNAIGGSKDNGALNFESLGRLQAGSLGVITNEYDQNDRFNVASFSEAGDSVILGSSYHLRRYQKKGGKMAVVAEYDGHEGGVRMVSPSIDDAYVVSGSLDQTARIWNQETGDLLASLFVANDGEWVLWTPEGYYAASPAGANYIGWHLNRGIDSLSDYISGDQLHSEFYRPDVVKKAILERRAAGEVVAELGLKFDVEEAIDGAPVAEIVDPVGNVAASNRRMTLQVRAVDGGQGIGELQVFHDGKRLQADGPGAFRDGALQVPFTISLLSGVNEIRAVAVSPEGVESVPAVSKISFEGTKATARCFLLAVGLNEYKNPRFNLNYCRPDVDAIVDAVEKRGGSLFSDIVVRKLYDEEATAEKISAELEKIAEEAEAEDVFLFAFAGHGVMSEGQGAGDSEFYMIPWDVTQMYGNDDLLSEKAISNSRLQQLTASIPARKQLMVLDACQSGGVVESFAVRGAAEERALAQLARSSGMYVLASTQTEQFATEAEELGHGLFTYALLEGLNGKGDGNSDGKVTIKEVEAWLNERVPELSEKHTGTAQYPNSFARGQDFPIGLIK